MTSGGTSSRSERVTSFAEDSSRSRMRIAESSPGFPSHSCARAMSVNPTRAKGGLVPPVDPSGTTLSSLGTPGPCKRRVPPVWIPWSWRKPSGRAMRSSSSQPARSPPPVPGSPARRSPAVKGSIPATRRASPGNPGRVTIASMTGVAAATPRHAWTRGRTASGICPRISRSALPETIEKAS